MDNCLAGMCCLVAAAVVSLAAVVYGDYRESRHGPARRRRWRARRGNDYLSD